MPALVELLPEIPFHCVARKAPALAGMTLRVFSFVAWKTVAVICLLKSAPAFIFNVLRLKPSGNFVRFFSAVFSLAGRREPLQEYHRPNCRRDDRKGKERTNAPTRSVTPEGVRCQCRQIFSPFSLALAHVARSRFCIGQETANARGALCYRSTQMRRLVAVSCASLWNLLRPTGGHIANLRPPFQVVRQLHTARALGRKSLGALLEDCVSDLANTPANRKRIKSPGVLRLPSVSRDFACRTAETYRPGDGRKFTRFATRIGTWSHPSPPCPKGGA